jgi:dihydrofolate reductase
MEFQEIDKLFETLENIPDGNLVKRIKPWNEIKNKLDTLEENIQCLENLLDSPENSDITIEESDEEEINIQDGIDVMQDYIEKIKVDNISITEVNKLYQDTLLIADKCEGEINKTKLTIYKSDNGGSLSGVSI